MSETTLAVTIQTFFDGGQSELPQEVVASAAMGRRLQQSVAEFDIPDSLIDELETDRYGELFRGLLERGIYVAPSQYECLFPSLAHGDEEIDATIEAVGDVLGG